MNVHLKGRFTEAHRRFTFSDKAVNEANTRARRMVLWPAVTVLGGTVGDVQPSLKLLIDGWRSTVDRLLSSGYDIPATKHTTMINCSPCMAWTHGEPTWPCNIRLCPWCYARRCISLLKKMGIDNPTVREGWGDDVGCRYLTKTEHLPGNASAAALREAITRRHIQIRDFMIANRDTIVGQSCAIDPYPDLDPEGNTIWSIRSPVLLLDKTGSQLINTPVGIVFSQVPPAELADVFVDIAPYPATLLTAPPRQLHTLSEACFKLRIRYRAGLLYEKDE